MTHHDLVYRFDPDAPALPVAPPDAASARARLLEGNASFVDIFQVPQVVHVPPSSIGLGPDGAAPPQRPFAAVLGCSDARVPVEFVFRCGANELFVVRVAGNVPGDECLGSLEYAAANLRDTLRLNVVLGHTGCGAVTVAVDTYLDPRTYPESGPLRAVVDRIVPSVRLADTALARAHGGRTAESAAARMALIETTVVVNTALAAMTVRMGVGLKVEQGVFDLETRRVELRPPPANPDALIALADEVAVSRKIRELLAG